MKPVRADYIEDQEEICNGVRARLIDWLVLVHNKCKFCRETLFLAVALLDRYLAQKPVPKNKLKLVGITAMRIAAKHEEAHVPMINDVVRICDNCYTAKEFYTTERLMLNTFDFQVSCPTTAHFLRFLEVGFRDEWLGHVQLASYLAELSLHDVVMLR